MPELKKRYGVEELWVFGSYVQGAQKEDSDLDLLVEFDGRPMGLLKFVQLQYYLSDLLGVEVDLVEKGALRPAIGHRVLREVVPV